MKSIRYIIAGLIAVVLFGVLSITQTPQQVLRSKRVMSLDTRYPNESVNQVFKENILLTLAYMENRVDSRNTIAWDQVIQPQSYTISLAPGEVFAFHEDVLPEYADAPLTTTNAHFNGADGFKSDGYLMGDGVCHLASLLYWAAYDAGLATFVPKNHDFATIPEVPREYGVSIYFTPGSEGANAQRNLYVQNTLGEPVQFQIDFDGSNLSVQVV